MCAADKIHNLSSLMNVFKEQGDALWSKFNAPVDKILWFNGEVLRILRTRMGGEIVRELGKVYTQVCEKTGFSG